MSQNSWDKVGNTPLLYIKSLSEKTGCHIWGKAEFQNPGGSIKDRAAKQIILEAESNGQLTAGGTIVEGTAGNTGIGLALLGRERGYKVVITMPNNQSQEKVDELVRLGAEVLQFPPCPFANPGHFYHQARVYAENHEGVFWANQFENLANFRAHYQNTGPEIGDQTQGKIDFFVASVGSGGTMGGVSRFLKGNKPSFAISSTLSSSNLSTSSGVASASVAEASSSSSSSSLSASAVSSVQTVVADPYGSGILDYLQSGQFKAEGSSVTEGIGIMRLTENFKQALVDRCLRVSDQEMIDMFYHLKEHDEMLVGTSSALNLAGIYKIALKAYKNTEKHFVTMLCDHGDRYRSKILSPDWLREKNLYPQPLKEN